MSCLQAVNKELKRYAKEGVVELRVERLMDEVRRSKRGAGSTSTADLLKQ